MCLMLMWGDPYTVSQAVAELGGVCAAKQEVLRLTSYEVGRPEGNQPAVTISLT
jgi:hypothetical protein